MNETMEGRRVARATIRAQAEASFIGRQHELGRLTACLERWDAAAPIGAVVMGEPGIGKTRLVTEALSRARPRPRVLRGRADELRSDRPFEAIADAVGPVDDAGSGREQRLAALLSHEVVPERSVDPGLRAQIVDAFVAVVGERARAAPTVLVIEDVQWADPGTLAVLGAICELGLSEVPTVLVTARGAPRSRPLDQLLGQLVARSALHLSLDRLSEEAVGTLVSALVGHRPGAALTAHVQRAAGNPLFVIELLDALAEEGALVATGEGEQTTIDVVRSGLPPSLRITMLGRLSALPEEALETLRVAALLGTTFAVDDLTAVMGTSTPQVLERLHEPLRLQWIVDAGDRLAFRHDLVREALTSDLPEAVRRALHRENARRLSAAGRDPGEVATQLLLGAVAPDPEAAAWLRRTGRRALSREPAVAVEHLRCAARLDPDGEDHDASALDLAYALLWSGRLEEGEAALRGLLERPHDPQVETDAALALARSRLLSGAGGEALEVLQAALTMVQDPVDRCRLTAERALAHVYRGELPDAEAAADEVLAPGGVQHDAAHGLAGGVRASLLAIRGDLAGALAEAEQAVAVTTRSRDREASRIPPQLFLASVLIDSDRFDEGWHQLTVARRVSDGLGTAWDVPVQHLISARARLFTGDLDDAEAECETALRWCTEAGVRVMEAWGHAMVALVRLHRLDAVGAREALEAGEAATAISGPQVRGVDWLLWARARLEVLEGRPGPARDMLGLVWAAHRDLGMRSERRLLGPDLVRLQLELRDRSAAEEVTAEVEQAGALMGTRSARAAGWHCRGLVDDDVEALVAAADETRPTTWRPQHTVHCLDAGAALLRSGHADDGVRLLEEARDLAVSCGLSRDLRQADAHLRRLGIRRGTRGTRRRPTAGWASLTPTERTVALHAAQGLSNPEIGELLYISRRTVQTHLSHVYAKLGISSRVELAREAARAPEEG